MTDRPFHILSLDGGGSLGVYSLGVLSEVELLLGRPLHEVFDLVYGTSTGAIIGSMIALGEGVDTVRERYLEVVPDVMGRWLPRSKSAALKKWATRIYGTRMFDAFLTNVGIVATHLEYNRPMVFKSDVGGAHGRTASFRPGFGCSIADAVVASCAAFPYFSKPTVATAEGGHRTVVDGGYSANNPSLFALTDAVGPLEIERARIRLLSLGTGSFPERQRLSARARTIAAPTFTTLLRTSSNTVETLRKLLFRDVATVRIDDARTDRRYESDFMERDVGKLKAIYDVGRESFAAREADIRTLFAEYAV